MLTVVENNVSTRKKLSSAVIDAVMEIYRDKLSQFVPHERT
jgi:hypothetical protein